MIDFPSSPTTGQIYNSGTGPIYIWDGVAWSLVTQATRTAWQNNLIVNPAMDISQENGNTASTTASYYPVDQWTVSEVGAVCSSQQVASITPDYNPNRIRKTVTTLKASLAAGDYSQFQQKIEGLRMVTLAYGTANAMQSVLRFGLRGPAGTYSIALRNSGATRTYIKNFTITAGQANTDTLQTFVIPGDTSGTWPSDNTPALILSIQDGVGTTYQGVEGWQAGNLMGTAANSNMVATNGNVVELFDVGLYPDPDKTGLPPPFIAPLYAQALIECQRYWQVVSGFARGYATVAGSYFNTGAYYTVPLRTNPTVGDKGGGTPVNCSAVTPITAGTSGLRFEIVSTTTGDFYSLNRFISANARM